MRSILARAEQCWKSEFKLDWVGFPRRFMGIKTLCISAFLCFCPFCIVLDKSGSSGCLFGRSNRDARKTGEWMGRAYMLRNSCWCMRVLKLKVRTSKRLFWNLSLYHHAYAPSCAGAKKYGAKHIASKHKGNSDVGCRCREWLWMRCIENH